MAVWNPWHGCKKISAGCDICYVYEKDAMYGKNASVIRRTANFDLPVKKNRRVSVVTSGKPEAFSVADFCRLAEAHAVGSAEFNDLMDLAGVLLRLLGHLVL